MAERGLLKTDTEMERVPVEKAWKAFRVIAELPFVQEILDTLPHPALILNPSRQAVFVNRSLLDMVETDDPEVVIGKRPGEIFNCTFWEKGKDGCGTSEYCIVCGGLLAFADCQRLHRPARREMQIMTRKNGQIVPFDVEVSVSPLEIGVDCYYIVNMVDISHEKRRSVLERMFFHDILNTASNINSLSHMLTDEQSGSSEDWAGLIQLASGRLMEEIESQRVLLFAERDELYIALKEVDVNGEIRQVMEMLSEQAQHHKVRLVSEIAPGSCECVTDRSLLHRVLMNLIKNAIEASIAGEAVTIGCSQEERAISVWVKNPAVIPAEQQLQIFQRSFSTKGVGRGLGTYSIKLLTEKFLQGRVSFSSTSKGGTCFTVSLPLHPELKREELR